MITINRPRPLLNGVGIYNELQCNGELYSSQNFAIHGINFGLCRYRSGSKIYVTKAALERLLVI